MTEIHKLVYCSRNEIRGSKGEVVEEVQKVLSSARTNNAKLGISGALLFNEGLFAQVLEGPLPAIEQVFEHIQQDKRHSDVTVLLCSPVETRGFPSWSMAFAGVTADSPLAFSIPEFDVPTSERSAAAEEVMSLLHQLVVQEDCILAG